MTSTVYIAKNVYGGEGLGRLGDGRVVFVKGAFAGEQVKAEIVVEKRSFVKAVLKEIVERSPDRIGEAAPPIPGMTYANLSYAGELKVKASQLRDFFERSRLPAGESAFANLLPAADGAETVPPSALHYRNKVVYHFARQGGRWVLGYRAEPSHEIVDIVEDPLARPEINAQLPEIRRALVSLLTTGPVAVRRDTERKGSLTIRHTARSGVKWWLGEAPRDLVLKEDTAGLVFEVPADGFYQVNPVAGEALVRAVTDEYERHRAESPDILDLYCGVGVFGLACAAHPANGGAAKLVGIESGRQAIDFAKRNALAQKQPSAKFFAERVGDNLRRIAVSPRSFVIVDPPRGGLERGVAKWLAASPAARIVYVSCDPATLMRDLSELRRGYEVESVRWVDMFPRTARFETLTVLRRR